MVNKQAIDWAAQFHERALKATDERLQRFYQRGVVAADTPLAEVPLVALDFETTGLDPAHDEIISIGLVPFDWQRIRLSESRYWLLKPNRGLTETSVPFHGITHSQLDDAPDLMHILEAVLEAIAGKIVVVHYRNIEREFLHSAVKKRLGEGIRFPMIDTMALEAMLYRYGLLSLLKRLIGWRRESIRLGDSRQRYHLPHYGQHHALTDAIATAELLQAQIRHRYSATTPLSELWV
ncbi:3'-5' exonuclease [Amphritea sp. 1_MG-2023]|uniref:3'-5' exonuclease n=1 Tax=Amphritea sp. 1_MG-2023 TaxID=3062670 RepID=UPI0026E15A20|nr:3'-5' exonuclease [Amphritea sp. 1_MG-2023]MDO6561947.1 3'-5' exonuclease [Amphritea sp. 1_MG-2023]